MANPLLGNLASDIYSAFNNSLAYNLTLHSVTESEAGDGSITQSESETTVRGLVVEYDNYLKFEGKVPDGARRCIVFQNSATVAPKMQDRITPLQGSFANEKMVCGEVSQDPAGAIWDIMLVPLRSA